MSPPRGEELAARGPPSTDQRSSPHAGLTSTQLAAGGDFEKRSLSLGCSRRRRGVSPHLHVCGASSNLSPDRNQKTQTNPSTRSATSLPACARTRCLNETRTSVKRQQSNTRRMRKKAPNSSGGGQLSKSKHSSSGEIKSPRPRTGSGALAEAQP